MNQLVPCPECSRHVRISETQCPFCAQPLDLASVPEPRLPQGRLSRAATFAFGATLASATALAACGGSAEESSTNGAGAGGAPSGAGGTRTDGGNGGSAQAGSIGTIMASYGGAPRPPVPPVNGTPPLPEVGGAAGNGIGGSGVIYGGPPPGVTVNGGAAGEGGVGGADGSSQPVYGGAPGEGGGR
jgi:hypothetical protein